MEEIITLVLSGSVGAGLMGIVQAALQRKWKKEDAKDDTLCALKTAQRVIMVDRVRHLGQRYIDAGEISLDDKDTLKEMYSAYKGLGGNGHLDTVMGEVDKLPVTGH